MAQKITFNSKSALIVDSEINVYNKIMAEDINEIKDVVNANSDIQVSSSDNSLVNVRHLTRTQFENMRANKTADINTWYEVENDEIVASTGTPIGSILIWPESMTKLPVNYMVCQGQELDRIEYAALFSIIGIRYGVGDGSTTFNLPNYKGRVVVGQDASQTIFNTNGKTGGSNTHTLTVAEMPNQTGAFQARTYGGSGNIIETMPQGSSGVFTYASAVGAQWSGSLTAGITATGPNHVIEYNNLGQNQSHNNLQPYIVGHYIIKVAGEAVTENMRNLDLAVNTIQQQMDLRGSCAVFYRGDSSQSIPAATSTIIQFDSTRFVDNDCFSLQANGTVKVLKDISRVLVTTAIRGNKGVEYIIYVTTSIGGGGRFNSVAGTNQEMANSSGILKVQKDAIITVSVYSLQASSIVGYDESWCGLNITVLK